MSQLPVACSLTTPELRERRERVLRLVRQHCRERHPLSNGYRLRFDPHTGILAALATLIDAERQCCPFLDFQLSVAADHGPVWLEMTGPAGTREFLDGELGLAGESLAAGTCQ